MTYYRAYCHQRYTCESIGNLIPPAIEGDVPRCRLTQTSCRARYCPVIPPDLPEEPAEPEQLTGGGL